MNVIKQLEKGSITIEEALEKIRLWKYRAPMYEFKEILKQEEIIKEIQKHRLRL